jgi:hypothetical protein
MNTLFTEPVWEDRILGRTEKVQVPVRTVFVATANNLSLNTDSIRRTIPIRLDAHVARPWLRTGWRHTDLRAWTDEHRSQLVAAALVLVRAWIVAGKPEGSGSLGSYGAWSRVLGGILDVVGVPGFLGNLDAFYESATAEDEPTLWLLDAWRERFGEAEVTVARDLWPLAENPSSPVDLGNGSDRARQTYLGQRVLGPLRDRQFVLDDGAEFRVERVGKRRPSVWRLRLTCTPGHLIPVDDAEGARTPEHLGTPNPLPSRGKTDFVGSDEGEQVSKVSQVYAVESMAALLERADFASADRIISQEDDR